MLALAIGIVVLMVVTGLLWTLVDQIKDLLKVHKLLVEAMRELGERVDAVNKNQMIISRAHKEQMEFDRGQARKCSLNQSLIIKGLHDMARDEK